MALRFKNRDILTNKEGFLVNRKDWDKDVGELIATTHGIHMAEAHWEVIDLLNSYCDLGNKPPSMRELSAEIKSKLGPEKARGTYLMKLFGPSPAKMAARVAGLPRPKNCL